MFATTQKLLATVYEIISEQPQHKGGVKWFSIANESDK